MGLAGGVLVVGEEELVHYICQSQIRQTPSSLQALCGPCPFLIEFCQ